ncbi:MAG: DUF4279 domain-containing protein [Thermoanaerobaculia bacterium]|nr:DUF4279 domain-containing protein [Thermoanaerobaculia bacterium]
MSYMLHYDGEPELVLSFMLSGDDLDPVLITEMLGHEPDEAWKKGDPWREEPGSRLRRRPPHMFGRWAILPRCSRHDPFETQVTQLLEQLEALPPVLAELTRTYTATISVGYASGEENIQFWLDSSAMQRLARLNLAIWFDIYATANASDDGNTEDT